MRELPNNLRRYADGDLREYARDSLIGVHPDQNELRQWADMLDMAADEIERLRTIVRVNALRHMPNVSHEDIDAVLYGTR